MVTIVIMVTMVTNGNHSNRSYPIATSDGYKASMMTSTSALVQFCKATPTGITHKGLAIKSCDSVGGNERVCLTRSYGEGEDRVGVVKGRGYEINNY